MAASLSLWAMEPSKVQPAEPGRGNSQRAFTTLRRRDRLLTLALLATTALSGCALVGAPSPADPPAKKNLSASPPSVSFGNVNVGSRATQTVTWTNTGNGNVTISQVGVSGPGFSTGPFTVPQNLAPGQSVQMSVVFAPTSAGSVTGSITVVTNAANSSYTLTLSGTGVATTLQLSASPTSLSFGNMNVGGTSSQNINLTNTGTSNVALSQVGVSGAGFSIGPFTVPQTLTPGQTTTVTVVFAPTSGGSVTGSVSVVSNATNSPATVTLSGTGVVVTLQLSANPTSLSFGTVNVGTSSSQNVILTNVGNSSVTISQVSISGAGFSASGLTLPLTLAASQTATLSVTFAPTAAGSVTGSVSVVSNATNSPLTLALSGTGFVPTFLLSASPTSLSFGNVTVGTSSTQTVALTNSGNSSVTISQVNVSGAGFSASGLTLPLTLTAGQSTALSVQFAPSAGGSVTGSLSVASNATNSPATVTLSGSGVVATFLLSASPTSLSFGNILLGSSSTQTVALTNSGNSSVTISQVNVSGAGFSASGSTLPLTLAAGQGTSLSVLFAPTVAGSVTGSLSVASNATNSPAVTTLSGSGVQPIAHSVTLSWTASTSVVVGYNVYRGTTSGGPYAKLNTSLVSILSYIDSAVQSGQTYFYVATAVDSNGNESTFSNEVSATIPIP